MLLRALKATRSLLLGCNGNIVNHADLNTWKKAKIDSTLLSCIRSTMNKADIDLECRTKGLDVVEYPLYRVFQVIYIFLSLTSFPSLLFVQIKYISSSIFHQNIKIIFLMYYSLALLHSVSYSVSEIYTLITSLIAEPCHFFAPTSIHATLQLCVFTANSGLVFSLVALCCERCVATIRSNKYESNGVTLGIVLVFLTIFGIATVMFYVYDVKDFDIKTWAIGILPPGSVKEFNRVAIAYIVVSSLSILTFFLLSRINRRRCSMWVYFHQRYFSA
ncbi:integral membrane protein Srb [Dictyocaulus viviparus]|uniref:Integral membrane protein Srb n=1 Tax=Dictyocaulus viviparus TaxID=29172 RepID=A0A0D8Y1M7_DICVI|nr:integral membrane protein Srb [Dictyocaulus viviparus]